MDQALREISLAKRCVMFLNELPKFSTPVLEVLRQAMEDRLAPSSAAAIARCLPDQFTTGNSQ